MEDKLTAKDHAAIWNKDYPDDAPHKVVRTKKVEPRDPPRSRRHDR
jgi:hypothetical protein